MTEIGQLLKSRYLISNLLSGGGFSVTYLAKDTHLPDYPDCVVKQLRLLSNDPLQVEKVREFFFNEAKMLRKLGAIHSQIPELLAYFTDEDSENFYIVQELVPGKTLKQLLGTEVKLTEPEVIYILKETLEVLEFIHSYNVIHLDIKPDNLILRQSDYKIALIDFGSVKQVRTQMATSNSLTPQTTTLGTPGYMPCEQSFGRPKLSSDFYALGMVAIRALTGIHPKELEEDRSTGEVLWKERTHIRPELKSLLDKMVRYHFNQRPQSASDILIELAKIASLYPEDVTRCSPRLQSLMGSRQHTQSSSVTHEPTRPSDALRARVQLPTIVASEPASMGSKAGSQPQNSQPQNSQRRNSQPNNPSQPSLRSKIDNPSQPTTRTPIPPGLSSSSPVPPTPQTASTQSRPQYTPKTQTHSGPASVPPNYQSQPNSAPAYPDTVLVPTEATVRADGPSFQNYPAQNSQAQPSVPANPVKSSPKSTDTGSQPAEAYPTPERNPSRRKGPGLKLRIAPLLVVTSAIAMGMVASWGGVRYLDRRAYTSDDRQWLSEARELASTDVEEAIRLAEQIPSNSPLYDRATELLNDLRAEQTLVQEQELLTRARDLSATDLEAAVEAVRGIQSNSPLYEEARLDSLEWQGQILETYLASSSQTLETLAPRIDIQSEALFLQYDASSDDKLLGEEGIRRVAIATMSVLRSRYTDFDRLVVYPKDGDMQGLLELDVWSAYEKGDIGLERLLEKIQVEDRLNSTPDQVAVS